MAFSISKGVLAVATSYSNGGYHYEKIDQFIQYQGLEGTPDQMQDLDSYRSQKGYLKRNVLEHTASKFEFNTPYIEYAQMRKLVKMLRKGMKLPKCSVAERKVRIRYYDDWTDDYAYAFCYVPDVAFSYGGTFKGVPYYQPTRFAFIEY